MVNFFGNLGVDWHLFIAQVINFTLLLWFLTRFVYRPVIARIEHDEEILAQAQRKVQELHEREERFAQKEKVVIAETKKRARAIIAEAEEVAEDVRSNARQEAQKERDAVVRQIKERLREIDHA